MSELADDEDDEDFGVSGASSTSILDRSVLANACCTDMNVYRIWQDMVQRYGVSHIE